VATQFLISSSTNVFILRGYEFLILQIAVEEALGIGLQELHGEMNAPEPPALDRKVAGPGGACAYNGRVVFLEEILGRVVFAYLRIRDEPDPFFREQLHPSIDHALVQVRVGDAVHEEPSHPVVPFEHGNQMPRLIQLRGAGKPGGPRPYDRDFFTGPGLGYLRDDPSLFKTLVYYRAFDCLYRYRRFVDAEDARPLARRGANPPGEFREIVRLMETLERFFPEPLVNEVVPLGYEVIYRAARGQPFM
jgi:hypothetical protein